MSPCPVAETRGVAAAAAAAAAASLSLSSLRRAAAHMSAADWNSMLCAHASRPSATAVSDRTSGDASVAPGKIWQATVRSQAARSRSSNPPSDTPPSGCAPPLAAPVPLGTKMSAPSA